ncbi:hypothetical protein TOPH_04413 [Tolypocladium ophioglossoides CBS 100239]|uniref:Uncharacterized protein n=1 Tax=Tolypocladium ophioglossoides (strain CBS 100239) TaxID=1163406 RepID=A0A0L0NAH4_TOLOC|nr:hypothetical protein TOPH_04413 [Tolypocladium ophioglossoides CBS 100239]
METSSAQRSTIEAAPQSPSWAALSIYETARRHCRERILVQPLLWTSRHLELLHCSFSDPYPAPPITVQSNFTGTRDGTKYLRRFFRPIYTSRTLAIQRFLSDPECPLECRTNLYLSLDDFPLVTLPCTTFFLRDESESTMLARPIAAHIEREHITTLRGKAMRPWACSLNPPVDAIHRIKWKNLFKVLCTTQDKELMYLYSANVPSSLLDKFDYPSIPPPQPASISIQITAIHYKPLETLRDRLLALILPVTNSHKAERKRKMEDEDEDEDEDT